jgi:hypothetical protein
LKIYPRADASGAATLDKFSLKFQLLRNRRFCESYITNAPENLRVPIVTPLAVCLGLPSFMALMAYKYIIQVSHNKRLQGFSVCLDNPEFLADQLQLDFGFITDLSSAFRLNP